MAGIGQDGPHPRETPISQYRFLRLLELAEIESKYAGPLRWARQS